MTGVELVNILDHPVKPVEGDANPLSVPKTLSSVPQTLQKQLLGICVV